MEHQIVTQESFTIIGMELKTTTQNGKNCIDIPRFWEKIIQKGQIDAIPNRKEPGTLLGICADFEPDGGFSYIVAAEVSDTVDIPAGMIARTIPAATYAVFTARGKMPAAIQEAFKYIYQEWLPHSTCRRGESAEFELYDARYQNGENAEADIYVPIVTS